MLIVSDGINREIKFSGVKILRPVSGVTILRLDSGVKIFNHQNLSQFQPNLHVKILVLSHVKISGLIQVIFKPKIRCRPFWYGISHVLIRFCIKNSKTLFDFSVTTAFQGNFTGSKN